MGLVSLGMDIVKVAGSVFTGVINLGSNALKLGGKIFKSTFGKIALGAGTMACLATDPNKEGGLFNNIRDGFSNLWTSIKNTVPHALGTAGLYAATGVMAAGYKVKEVAGDIADKYPDAPFTPLMEYISEGNDGSSDASKNADVSEAENTGSEASGEKPVENSADVTNQMTEQSESGWSEFDISQEQPQAGS